MRVPDSVYDEVECFYPRKDKSETIKSEMQHIDTVIEWLNTVEGTPVRNLVDALDRLRSRHGKCIIPPTYSIGSPVLAMLDGRAYVVFMLFPEYYTPNSPIGYLIMNRFNGAIIHLDNIQMIKVFKISFYEVHAFDTMDFGDGINAELQKKPSDLYIKFSNAVFKRKVSLKEYNEYIQILCRCENNERSKYYNLFRYIGNGRMQGNMSLRPAGTKKTRDSWKAEKSKTTNVITADYSTMTHEGISIKTKRVDRLAANT